MKACVAAIRVKLWPFFRVTDFRRNAAANGIARGNSNYLADGFICVERTGRVSGGSERDGWLARRGSIALLLLIHTKLWTFTYTQRHNYTKVDLLPHVQTKTRRPPILGSLTFFYWPIYLPLLGILKLCSICEIHKRYYLQVMRRQIEFRLLITRQNLTTTLSLQYIEIKKLFSNPSLLHSSYTHAVRLCFV